MLTNDIAEAMDDSRSTVLDAFDAHLSIADLRNA